MCGFVGIIDKNNFVGKHDEFLDYAINDLNRRGPDSQLKWKSDDKTIEFAFARLSIRDLSRAGDQPMTSSKNRYTIVYNGEVYNTEELIKWSLIDTKKLNGSSDTELILECFERKGVHETIKKLDGIFAIALFDSIENKLYLIRDHAGVKPLYMGINKKGIVFSSHYHHITSHSFFTNEEINNNSLANYFSYGFIQEGEGLVENTYFLPHSHITTVNLSNYSWEWNAYFNLNFKNHRKKDINSFLEKYIKVVKSQLVSDVPIGTFLSGGIDSSLTTVIASSLKPNITAFTIGIKNNKKLDESIDAKRFAANFNINHKIKYITSNDIIELISQYDDSLCEPLADFSSLLTLKVCLLAKKELTVVLSGDGGDELFWGYPRFSNTNKLKYLFKYPTAIRAILILLLRLLNKKIPFAILKYKSFEEYYLSKQGLPGNLKWVNKILKKQNTIVKPFFYKKLQQDKIINELDKAKQLEYDIHLQRVLLKVDRASMFHSLEVRTPLLSKEIVELSTFYDYNMCYNKDQGKIPLREALQTFLPKNQKSSGEKKGFEPPMGDWLRNELKEKIGKTILNVPLVLQQFIDLKSIEELWNDHQANKIDNSWAIWSIYSLFIWVNKKMRI